MVKTMKDDVYRLGSEPGVSYGLLDLTNPAAAKWIEDIIYAMAVDTGAAGWMADFGEYLPFDCILHSGELPIAVHNRYPEDWAALNRRAMRRAGLGSVAEGGNGEGVFWSRSASSQTPRHTPLMWLGDQMVSWDAHDGMKSALMGMLQGGLSGLSLSHSDVGGYTATPGRHRSAELLMRWMELSALADAVFRTHQGNRPLHNAQPWDTPELLEHLAAFAKLHQAGFVDQAVAPALLLFSFRPFPLLFFPSLRGARYIHARMVVYVVYFQTENRVVVSKRFQ